MPKRWQRMSAGIVMTITTMKPRRIAPTLRSQVEEEDMGAAFFPARGRFMRWKTEGWDEEEKGPPSAGILDAESKRVNPNRPRKEKG